MEKPFDFNEQHRDSTKFMDCVHVWQIADIYEQGDLMFSPRAMSNLEVRESIIGDITSITMYEIQNGQKLNFTKKELLRHVSMDQHTRILDQLEHPDVKSLLTNTDGQIRIRDNHEIRQMAMDYSGIWYTGYTTSGNEVIVCNPEAIGSIENIEEFAKMLAMDINQTNEGSKSLQ